MSTVGNWRGPSIVKEGLLLYLDASSPNSYYSSMGNNWKDISGNGYNGVLTNGPTYSTLNGGSFIFDGINNYYNITSPINSNMNTISIYVNMQSTSVCPIVYYGSDNFDSNLWTWGIAVFPTGTHGFSETTLLYPTTSLYTESVDIGVWKNFTLVRNDNGDAKLYKNGILVGTSVGVGTTALRDSGDRLYIAKSGTTYGSFYLGSLLVYDRSLSSSEVLQNFNKTKSRFGL
jgi:hypothetical protein